MTDLGKAMTLPCSLDLTNATATLLSSRRADAPALAIGVYDDDHTHNTALQWLALVTWIAGPTCVQVGAHMLSALPPFLSCKPPCLLVQSHTPARLRVCASGIFHRLIPTIRCAMTLKTIGPVTSSPPGAPMGPHRLPTRCKRRSCHVGVQRSPSPNYERMNNCFGRILEV